MSVDTIIVALSPILMGVVGFFLVRFVNRHDDFKKDVYDKLDSHADEINVATSKIEKAVAVVHKDLYESQQIMLNFKSSVQDELYKVKLETKNVVVELQNAGHKAKQLHNLYEKTEETLKEHQRILQLAARAVTAHKQELEKLKSEVVKINDEIILIKKKS